MEENDASVVKREVENEESEWQHTYLLVENDADLPLDAEEKYQVPLIPPLDDEEETALSETSIQQIALQNGKNQTETHGSPLEMSEEKRIIIAEKQAKSVANRRQLLFAKIHRYVCIAIRTAIQLKIDPTRFHVFYKVMLDNFSDGRKKKLIQEEDEDNLWKKYDALARNSFDKNEDPDKLGEKPLKPTAFDRKSKKRRKRFRESVRTKSYIISPPFYRYILKSALKLKAACDEKGVSVRDDLETRVNFFKIIYPRKASKPNSSWESIWDALNHGTTNEVLTESEDEVEEVNECTTELAPESEGIQSKKKRKCKPPLTPEEVEHKRFVTKMRQYLRAHARTPEELERDKEKMRKYRMNLSAERKKEQVVKNRLRRHNFTPEEKKRHYENVKRASKKYFEKLKVQDYGKYLKVTKRTCTRDYQKLLIWQRERVKNETPEQREKRLTRYKIRQAKSKFTKELEDAGHSPQEIEKRWQLVKPEIEEKCKQAQRALTEYKPRLNSRKPKTKIHARKSGGHTKTKLSEVVCSSNVNVMPQNVTPAPVPMAEIPHAHPIPLSGDCGRSLPLPQITSFDPPPPSAGDNLTAGTEPLNCWSSESFQDLISMQSNSNSQQPQSAPNCSQSNIAATPILVSTATNTISTPQHEASVLHSFQSSPFPEENDIHDYNDDNYDQSYSPSLPPEATEITPSREPVVNSSYLPTVVSIELQGLVKATEPEIPVPPRRTSLMKSSSKKTNKRKTSEPKLSKVSEPTASDEVAVKTELEHEDILAEKCEIDTTPSTKKRRRIAHRVICDECGKSLTPSAMKIHKHCFHNPDKRNNKCPKCGQEFARDNQLWNHWVNFHELQTSFKRTVPKRSGTLKNAGNRRGGPVSCDHCGKSFAQKATLDDHVRRVHLGLKFICEVCGKEQQTAGKLWRHKAERHGIQETPPNADKVVSCEYCGEQILRSYPTHVKKYHPEHLEDVLANLNIVPIAAEAFLVKVEGSKTPKTVKSELSSSDEETVQCPICSKVILRSSSKRHLRNMHSVGETKAYTCSQCNRVFKENYRLNEHIRLVHTLDNIDTKIEAMGLIKRSRNNREVINTCSICDEKVLCRPSMRGHLVAIHPDVFERVLKSEDPEWKCSECSEVFSKETLFRAHLQSSHPSKSFYCSSITCLELFSTSSLLRNHVMYVHEGKEIPEQKKKVRVCVKEKAVKKTIKKKRQQNSRRKGKPCYRCDQKFTNLECLSEHVKNEHPSCYWPCSHCNFLYYTERVLAFHLTTCSKNTNKSKMESSGIIPIHMVRVECNLCSKEVVLCSLTGHLKVKHYIIEASFTCEHCQKSFRTREYWASHLENVHGIFVQTAQANSKERKVSRIGGATTSKRKSALAFKVNDTIVRRSRKRKANLHPNQNQRISTAMT